MPDRTYVHVCVYLWVKQILCLWIPEVPSKAKESNQPLLVQPVSSPGDLICHILCVCVYTCVCACVCACVHMCMNARMNMCVSIHVQVHS